MRHWHYDMMKRTPMSHSHSGGNVWHTHRPRLDGYGRTKKTLRLKR